MQKIQINTHAFFEILKERQVSMWDIFAELMNSGSSLLVFLNQDGTEIFSYQLPKTLEELKQDQKKFAEEFRLKIQQQLN